MATKRDEPYTFDLADLREHVEALQKIIDDANDSPDDVASVSFPNIRARARAIYDLAPDHRAADTEGEPKVGGAMDSKLRARGHLAVAGVFGGGAVADAAIGRMVQDTHIKSKG
jgi:hypothetical protein